MPKRTPVPKKQFDNSPPPPKKKPKKPKHDKVVEGLKRAADDGVFDDLLGGGKRRRRKKTGKKRKASAAFLKAGNDWRAHVKKTMAENKNMKFGKKLLKLASRTYKKGGKDVGISGGGPRRTKKRTKRRNRRSFIGF